MSSASSVDYRGNPLNYMGLPAFNVEFSSGSYDIVRELGRGSHGTVYRAVNEKSGSVALKALNQLENQRIFAQEQMILRSLESGEGEGKRWISFIEETLSFEGYTILRSPLADRDLSYYTCGVPVTFSLQEFRKIVKQLLEGLEYLKKEGVIHADIKPENILLMPDGNVKIADFGLAFHEAERKEGENTYATPVYVPPEGVLRTGEHGYAADMWSLGCTIAEVAAKKTHFADFQEGRKPWLGLAVCQQEALGKYPHSLVERASPIRKMQIESTLIKRERDAEFPPLIEEIAPTFLTYYPEEGISLRELQSLLNNLFVLEPKERATPSEMLCHPFVRLEQAISEAK